MSEASRSDPKISCRGLWKLFGPAAETACARRAPGTSVEQAIDGTDAIIGARDVNIDIAPGELFVIMGPHNDKQFTGCDVCLLYTSDAADE